MVPNGLYVTNDDLATLPNQSPDIGLSPGFNSWMTIFGQFFDHGLDLVTKGNAGTVYIPLQPDDPLIAGDDGILGNTDDLPAHLQLHGIDTCYTVPWMQMVGVSMKIQRHRGLIKTRPTHRIQHTKCFCVSM